jgi:hypothetical protein
VRNRCSHTALDRCKPSLDAAQVLAATDFTKAAMAMIGKASSSNPSRTKNKSIPNPSRPGRAMLPKR